MQFSAGRPRMSIAKRDNRLDVRPLDEHLQFCHIDIVRFHEKDRISAERQREKAGKKVYRVRSFNDWRISADSVVAELTRGAPASLRVCFKASERSWEVVHGIGE